MFTGLIQHVGEVRSFDPKGALRIASPLLAPVIGESIAVDGVCLTLVAHSEDELEFQVGPETLARTTLGARNAGDRVNLERALRAGDPLGGHYVTGHVDCTGSIRSVSQKDSWRMVAFSAPRERLDLLVPQGSITVDGTSLTIVEVDDAGFSVMLIPHTLMATTLGEKTERPGARVNLEFDPVAKQVKRLWEFHAARFSR